MLSSKTAAGVPDFTQTFRQRFLRVRVRVRDRNETSMDGMKSGAELPDKHP